MFVLSQTLWRETQSYTYLTLKSSAANLALSMARTRAAFPREALPIWWSRPNKVGCLASHFFWSNKNKSTSSHLSLNVLDADVEGCVVPDQWSGPALQELLDLQLQVSIGLLQVAHFGQVRGQTVVKVLHGELLVGRGDVNGIAQVEASSSSSGGERRGGLGDTNPGASSSSVHTAHTPPTAVGAGGEGGRGRAGHVVAAAGEASHG